MRTKVILGLMLSCSILGASVGAQPVPPKDLPQTLQPVTQFTSDEKFLEWIGNYYKSPSPREIPQAFLYFIDSPLMQDEARRMPIAAFFGAAFRETPDLAKAINQQVDARPDYNTLFAFANALWFTNADWARDYLRTLADRESNEQVAAFLSRRAQGASPIGEGLELRSLVQLETMWGEFGATGNPRLAERVAEVLLIEFEQSPSSLILQQAAERSLRLRAREHEPVRKGIADAIAKAPPSPRRDALQKLLDDETP